MTCTCCQRVKDKRNEQVEEQWVKVKLYIRQRSQRNERGRVASRDVDRWYLSVPCSGKIFSVVKCELCRLMEGQVFIISAFFTLHISVFLYVSVSAFFQLWIQFSNTPLTWKARMIAKSRFCTLYLSVLLTYICCFSPSPLNLISLCLWSSALESQPNVRWRISHHCFVLIHWTWPFCVCMCTCMFIGVYMCVYECVKILTRYHTPLTYVHSWWLVAGVGSEFKNTQFHTNTHALEW